MMHDPDGEGDAQEDQFDRAHGAKRRAPSTTIGVSSLPGEAAAVGVDYATRGRRANEATGTSPAAG